MIGTKPRWTEHANAYPPPRPLVLYEYYVTGRGNFPYDMLRHDACWPATSHDAEKLGPGWSYNSNPPELMKQRSIRMLSHQKPEVDRWSSFLWSCGTEALHR